MANKTKQTTSFHNNKFEHFHLGRFFLNLQKYCQNSSMLRKAGKFNSKNVKDSSN